jgi:ABC-type dipeptide/oligopeptide/nickel transport system permease subunit
MTASATPLDRPSRLSRPAARRGRLRSGIDIFRQRRITILGAAIVLFELIVVLIGPTVARYDPNEIDVLHALEGPSLNHLLGTDDLGRDILSRLLVGSRISLRVSVVAVSLAAAAGIVLGMLSGYAQGFVDEVIMRTLDSLMALPSLVLALTIAAVLGPGIENATIAIAVTAVPVYARLMRGQTLSVKQNDYVLAAQALGATNTRIIARYIFPNTVSPIIVQASLGLGFAIITESSLSFLGLGAQPPTPTWGAMVQVGFQYLESAPWFVLAPAGAIFIAVLGFNLVGDGLRDALDPTMRRG